MGPGVSNATRNAVLLDMVAVESAGLESVVVHAASREDARMWKAVENTRLWSMNGYSNRCYYGVYANVDNREKHMAAH